MAQRIIDSSGRDVPDLERRNEGATQVMGISASTEFWAEVDKRADQTGLGRSGVIVEALIALWKLKDAETRSVGRPRKKVFKRGKS